MGAGGNRWLEEAPRDNGDQEHRTLNCLSRLKKKQRAFNSGRKEGRKKQVGCFSVSLWAREKQMGCSVYSVTAFRVQNKWRLV